MPFESHVSLLEYQYMRLLKLFKKVIISAKKSYELNAPYLLVSYALKTQNYRLSDLVKNTSSIAMHFNKEEEFLNLNTLKDYELAVQILKERANG